MALIRYTFAAVLALLLTTAFQNFTLHAQSDEIKQSDLVSEAQVDHDALVILKQVSDTLASLKEFSFDADITNDNSLDNGQTVQVGGLLKVSVKRPAQVHAEYTGDGKTRNVWYDKKELTVYNPDKGFYGVIKTPESIDETMDFLVENYGFSLPIADIVSSDPYSSFIGTTREGFVVGDSVVDGKNCVHLAMRGEFADWQIWVTEEDPALPCKLVINYTKIEGVPQYQAVFSNWNIDPKLNASVFKPEIPKEAVKIDFINFKTEGDKNDEQ